MRGLSPPLLTRTNVELSSTLTVQAASAEKDQMDPAVTAGVNELREAISAYHAYRHSVAHGMLLARIVHEVAAPPRVGGAGLSA